MKSISPLFISSYNLTIKVNDVDDICPYLVFNNDSQQQPIIVYENNPLLIKYLTVDPDTNHTTLNYTTNNMETNVTVSDILMNSTGVYFSKIYQRFRFFYFLAV